MTGIEDFPKSAKEIITARNKPDDTDNGGYLMATDLSKPEINQKVVDEMLAKFGKLDILINNMGGSETPGGGSLMLSDNDWEQSISNQFTVTGAIKKSDGKQRLYQPAAFYIP